MYRSLNLKKIHYRSYKNFNETDFRHDIEPAPFHVAHIFDEVDDIAWFSSELLVTIINDHAPLKTKYIKKRSVPYMNNRLRKAQYQRNMARNKFKKFGNAYWDENRRHRNKVVAIRKESMATYFKQRCSKNDKTFWDTIAPFFTDKRNRNASDIVLKDGDDVVSDPAKVTEIFNTYFSNVASTIGFEDEIVSVEDALQKHSQHPSVLKIKMNTPELPVFNFHLLKVSDVESKLKNIDVKKATGYDKIPGKLLSKAYRELSVPMTNVLNTCISRSEFPAVLKCAELNPIYKKKDNLAEENYRPVSVLTALSKIYESSLNDQLLQHFITIFNDFLSAYRNGYSCQSLLVKVIDDWKKSLDKNHIVGAVFMDLSKAFDSLPHSLLISKLNAYGLSISACNLMASYLQDRKQRVKLGPVRSTWSNLTKGVPQGSILGPVLFNVFMNDLFYFIKKCSLYNYADDNSMSNASAKIDEVMLNLKLDSKIAITWFIDNGMEPHPEKFQFMVMSNNVIDTHTLELDDTTRLRSQSDVVLLGIKIDDKLTFAKHVSAICTKASKQLNAFTRISKFLSYDSKKLVINSFINSNFQYSPLVWHFCGHVNNNKIEKIRERSLRILHQDYDSSYEALLEKADFSSSFLCRLRFILLEVFKCLKKINPKCMNNLFEVKQHDHCLRDGTRLLQPKVRTTTHGLRTISYLGAKLWNDLPVHMKNIHHMDPYEFKSMLLLWEGPDLFSTYQCYMWYVK